MFFSLHAGYSFVIVDNTEDQCKIQNKQITDGSASFDPTGVQTIGNHGGSGSMTVKTFLSFSSFKYHEYLIEMYR